MPATDASNLHDLHAASHQLDYGGRTAHPTGILLVYDHDRDAKYEPVGHDLERNDYDDSPERKPASDNVFKQYNGTVGHHVIVYRDDDAQVTACETIHLRGTGCRSVERLRNGRLAHNAFTGRFNR